MTTPADDLRTRLAKARVRIATFFAHDVHGHGTLELELLQLLTDVEAALPVPSQPRFYAVFRHHGQVYALTATLTAASLEEVLPLARPDDVIVDDAENAYWVEPGMRAVTPLGTLTELIEGAMRLAGEHRAFDVVAAAARMTTMRTEFQDARAKTMPGNIE